MDAAGGHAVASVQNHLHGSGVADSGAITQEEGGKAGTREFGRAAETAVYGVVLLLEFGRGAVEEIGGDRTVPGLGQDEVGEAGMEVVGRVEDFGAVVLPDLGDLLEDLQEAGAAEFALGRKVGAGVEGFEVGGEETVEGPPSLAGHGLNGGHVYFVNVGALFAIHFDADKVGVEEGGDGAVLEGFAFHDVAPVAGGVADTEENGFVFRFGAGEGLVAPREPVHRVVLVLEEVGRLFQREAVGGWMGHVCWSYGRTRPDELSAVVVFGLRRQGNRSGTEGECHLATQQSRGG